ncbi:MAG: class I SAM-dependent methyltransferase [Deltaproteobacteria bacterium]|jgi:ubiquinone/menaquinone biosynthesis C-methylase UbiE|nr:class I SAM-dependent methyltransferase [Deltaproteobacteria bacterium]
MSFSDFFSKQARKPSGIFGRLVMSVIFDVGNARLNKFVNEVMSVQEDDRILEIGFGTGKLIHEMAKQIDRGLIEGVDFSKTMVSIAQKRNKKHIASGKVKIVRGNFDEMPYEKEGFNKVCSANTIYFWTDPETTAKKIAGILKPGGKFVAAFEDIAHLEQRRLNHDVFRLYSKDDVRNLLINAGFPQGVSIESRALGSSVLNCAIALK